jgi:hypothetical protein
MEAPAASLGPKWQSKAQEAGAPRINRTASGSVMSVCGNASAPIVLDLLPGDRHALKAARAPGKSWPTQSAHTGQCTGWGIDVVTI